MFWRIVGAIFSLTFFAAAFSIWGDPYCQTITMHGGRFGIAYTCLNDSSGTSAGGAAWGMFFIGLALLVFNLWPFIRAGVINSRNKHENYLADVDNEQVFSDGQNGSQFSESRTSGDELKEFMRPTNCQNCDQKLSKRGKFCQNCGTEVVDQEVVPETIQTDSFEPEQSEISASAASQGEPGGTNFKVFGIIAGILLVIVLIIAASNSGGSTDSSQDVSTPTPTPTETAKTYSMSAVLAGAGDGFSYVSEGFAMKWANDRCKKYTTCSWVKIYSIDDCKKIQFSLTFTDKAETVVGKDVQTGPFGLSAGETGKYELKFQTGSAFGQIDEIKCLARPYSN